MVTLFTAVTSMPARVLSKYLFNVGTKGPTTAPGSLLPYLWLVFTPEMHLPHQDQSDFSLTLAGSDPGTSSLRNLSDTEVFADPEHALLSHASPLTFHITAPAQGGGAWTDKLPLTPQLSAESPPHHHGVFLENTPLPSSPQASPTFVPCRVPVRVPVFLLSKYF